MIHPEKLELINHVNEVLEKEGYSGWKVAENGILSQGNPESVELLDPNGTSVMSYNLPQDLKPMQRLVARAICNFCTTMLGKKDGNGKQLIAA